MSHYTLRKAIHIPNTPTSKGQSSKPATLLRLKKNTQKKKTTKKQRGGRGSSRRAAYTTQFTTLILFITFGSPKRYRK